MALKFLNKKGWHTGSLRNIENVWKAEQKHDAEQKKLEELRKQIQDEREQSEFRQLQEQAGLVPKQERLEFLYDSGLAVGKSSSDSFALGKPAEPQKTEADNELNKLAAAPGALFVEEKPASANDTWRKLHSDPLLMIRQREQEALSQIKNNPVKMEMIKKSLDAKKLKKEEKKRKKSEKKKHKKEKRKRETGSDSDSSTDTLNKLKKMHHKDKPHKQSMGSNSQSKMDRGLMNEEDMKSRRDHLKEPTRYNANFKIPPYREHLKNNEKLQERRYDQERSRSPLNYRRHRAQSPSENRERHRSRSPSNHGKILSQRQSYRARSPSGNGARHRSKSPSDHVQSLHHRQRHKSQSPSDHGRRHRSHSPDGWGNGVCTDHRNKFASQQVRESNSHARGTDCWPTEKKPSAVPDIHTKPVSRPKYQAGKLSEEEKAARLSEMQMDAELHDEQRWQRLKKASEADAREAMEAAKRSGKNFLDATNKSVYGAEKGGSSTIEESVRRRTHYLQGSAAATEGNAFRR